MPLNNIWRLAWKYRKIKNERQAEDILDLHPERSVEEEGRFQAALDEINKKYGVVLKRLAENETEERQWWR